MNQISQYSVQRTAQRIDKAVDELTACVTEMKDLLDKSRESGDEQRDLKVLSTISNALLMGAEVNARSKVRTYLEDIPFEHVKSDGRENIGYCGVPKLLKVAQVLAVEKEEVNARKEEMTYCDVCRKAVKNMKSHSKAQSHRGRVRIKELKNTGWVQIRETNNNNEWGRLISELHSPDVPNIRRMSQYNTQDIDPTIYGVETRDELDDVWRQQSVELVDRYKSLIAQQAYNYNGNGSENRYGGKLWVKDSISNFGDVLAGSCKREDRPMNSVSYRKRRENPALERQAYQKRKAWRANIDKVLFDPSKIKIWATMQALKG